MGILTHMSTDNVGEKRKAPNRSRGESEMRLNLEFFEPLKRIYVAQPRSAKARKHKKRHQAWTLTKEFQRQAAPRLRFYSILDRQLDPSRLVIFDEADRLTNGHFSKHFNFNRNPSLDVPEQNSKIIPVKTNDNVISDRARAYMDTFKPVVLEGTLKEIAQDDSKPK